jgi:UDP:flavonoid glycosyltransferase YjiC (YdhE family)
VARIAFAWELGGELGHAMACSALARALHAHGHRIAYMFRELHQLAFLSDSSAYDVYQAPVLMNEGMEAPIPASFADILFGCGYANPRQLAGLIGSWTSLLARWKPDVLVSDFAPTALLAARALGVKRVAYGNGFQIPPRLTPIPPFRFDAEVDLDAVKRMEAVVLGNINTALARFDSAPLANLAEQFETEEDFLATFPELDSYGNRPATGYWGPRFSVDSGVSVHWPAGSGKRVLLYLKKTTPQLDSIIRVLAASPHRVAAFIPDLEPARRDLLRGGARIVSERPMRLAGLLEGCDLFISMGGNVSVGALMSGVPQLVLPGQYEQYITAHRHEQLGVGLWLKPEATQAQISEAIQRLLGSPRFMTAARAFPRRYPDYSPAEQQRRIVHRIEEIAAAPPRILSPTANRSKGRSR